MSELQQVLSELNRLRLRVAQLEVRQEHPGFAASDVVLYSWLGAGWATFLAARLRIVEDHPRRTVDVLPPMYPEIGDMWVDYRD